MAKTSDHDKVKYMTGLIAQLVEKIEALQEEVAAPAIYGQDISANRVCDRLEALLEVEAPDGETGKLSADEGGVSIIYGVKITGMRVISGVPGAFEGVVWSEEMDRAPKPDSDEEER